MYAARLLPLTLLCSCGPCAPAVPPATTLPPRPEPSAARAREPAVAGEFYPADGAELSAAVAGYLARAKNVSTAPVKLLLVPHAGLEFSGQVAAGAFAELEPGFTRVVALAANHSDTVDYAGLAVDHPTGYRLPGFELPISPVAAPLLLQPGFVEQPAVHGLHMIEVELPFLRQQNGASFELVPIVVGRLDRAAQLAAAERLAQLLGLMNELAARLGLAPRLVGYANSGDGPGDRDRVVGYGALVYEERLVPGPEGSAMIGR